MRSVRIRQRRGKQMRERAVALILVGLSSPLFLACAALIKAEGLLRRDARGPVFFRERRMSRGEPFDLLKFRTLTASALAQLDEGPTHIAKLELPEVCQRIALLQSAHR